MAHLDLEEQEQLDQFKHFWNQYGSLITWALFVLLAVYAGWNGWHYWQNRQAVQATALYEEVERLSVGGDAARLDGALAEMKKRFGGTLQAQQAALLVAQAHANAGRSKEAQAALQWVVDESADSGYRAVARLRLAGLLLDAKSYDEALKQVSGDFPAEFAPLAADRRGDIELAQGHKEQAGADYLKAWQGLAPGDTYRRVIDVKLASLGMTPSAGAGK